MLNFGAILMSTNEYANGRHTPPGESMNLRRLYIGGLPSHVIAPTVKTGTVVLNIAQSDNKDNLNLYSNLAWYRNNSCTCALFNYK